MSDGVTEIGWEHARGWRPFGFHVDFPMPAGWVLEFTGEGEDGLPVWERLERVGEPSAIPLAFP